MPGSSPACAGPCLRLVQFWTVPGFVALCVYLPFRCSYTLQPQDVTASPVSLLPRFKDLTRSHGPKLLAVGCVLS